MSTGISSSSLFYPGLTPSHTVDPDLYLRPLVQVRNPFDIGPTPVTGSKSVVAPVVTPKVMAGVDGQGYLDQFYGKIHVTPSTLDFGNILSNQVRYVNLWNGLLTPVNLTDSVGTDMEGIVVIEPLTPPVEIGPLGEYQYEFSVNLEGPPSINASYVWTIDGQNYTLELRGTRIVVLQANADWSSPVEETLSWATDVMIAVDGTEQRVGLNTNPRQVVKFDIKTDTAENTQYVMNQVYGWANRIFALPMWENESVLTVDHNIGDTTIQFDPAGWGHIEGGLIYLWGGDFHNYESVVIDSFGASNIVLSAPLTKKWGRGTRIAPIARGFLPRSTKLDYLTDGMVKGSFNFTVDSYQTSAVINTVAAPALLNGLEYYDEAPNWADILTHSFESDYVLLDRGYGRVVQEAINDYPVEVFRHSWLLGSRDEINLFKEFIKRREGRRVPVYIPTHKTDFVVVDATSVAVPLITVANSGYSTFIPVTSRRYGIRLEMVDGTVILRALLGMSKLDDNEVLTLDSGVGDYQPAQFRKVSLIKLCRLKSDSVKITWVSNSIAKAAVDWVEVAR